MNQSQGHRRGLGRLGQALRELILGKSGAEYMRKIAGGAAYWQDEPYAPHDNVAPPIGRQRAEIEPVFGFPRSEVEAWLEVNPAYVPVYEEELDKRRSPSAGSTR